jgi:Protein of unknown function (DUF3306)
MSEPESFLARWSRRKAESGDRREVSPAGPAAGHGEAKPEGREVSLDPPPATGEPAADFDPASLPPIESITAGADIRPFLQSGVPAELMRAALRRAWATDPAIRDFVGIADNQWDFNDPTAMPGFGPLTAADRAATLAAQMPGGASDGVGPIADASVAAAPAKPEARVEAASPPALAGKGPADGETVALAMEGREGNLTRGDDGDPEFSGERRAPRSHGGALPR